MSARFPIATALSGSSTTSSRAASKPDRPASQDTKARDMAASAPAALVGTSVDSFWMTVLRAVSII